jgi:hypothetical protein
MKTKTTLRRAVLTAAVVVAAAMAALGGAQTAQAAGPGTFDYATSRGRCDQTLQMTLIITGPGLIIYGLTPTPDRVDIWYRLVDLIGNGQTQWIFKGTGQASSTAPARAGVTQITRPAWTTYSRIQYFVQFYQRGVYTRYAQGTVQSYDRYSSGGLYFGKT